MPYDSDNGMGPEIAKAAIAVTDARHANARPGVLAAAETAAATGLPYRQFKITHPDYDPGYWRRLRALYSGGKELLNDEELLHSVFPRHRDEHVMVYRERCRRAFYVPYAGEIIDHIVAALSAQPVTMAPGELAAPEFYDDFFWDVSPPGGLRISLNHLLREQILSALLYRSAWTLIDLPVLRDDNGAPVAFDSRAEQENSGALDAYAVRLEPESVVDWEEDDSGELLWALVHTVESKREGLRGTRDFITHRWTFYDRDGWARYALRHKRDQPPKDTDLVALVDEGTHSFGRVPLLRLQVPEGLWAMSKLESLAREHLNKRSSLGWAETQSLLPELYEFEGPEEPGPGAMISEAQEDESRAWNQPRGQGFVQVRGHQDRAEFVGPDPSAFKHAMESCNNIRDEMHRVTHQMALSVDNTSAALRRSGESKAHDKAATAVVLVALGKLVRHHAEDIYRMVSLAREEYELADEWTASGMEKFDAVAADDAIESALTVDQLNIESATFRRRHRFALCKLILGDDATPEDIETIEKELTENIPDEIDSMMTGAASLPLMEPEPEPERPEPREADDDDDDDDGDKGGGSPPRRNGPTGRRTMMATSGFKK